MKGSELRVGALAILMLCARCLPALAQTTASTAPTSSAGGGESAVLEEIVVTARRRAENNEDVPATIVALSAKSIEQRGIEVQSDLQAAVPGLVVRSGQNQNMLNFVIRGESLDGYSGSVPGVQPYVNEVPVSANNAASFYDLESIQVLKGPQGTLFGRNSTGGSVLIQTQRPTNDFDGYAQVQYGNLDRLVTEGAVDVPLVSDKVLIRFAGTWTKGGDFVRNLYDDRTYGNDGERSGRVTLLLKPIDALTNTTTAEFSKFSGTNAPLFPFYVVPCGGTGPGNTCKWDPSQPIFNKVISSPTGTYLPGYPNGYVYPGGMATLTAFVQSKGNYVVDVCCDFTHEGSNEAVQNSSLYELSSSVSVKNIFGFSRTHSGNAYGDSETPYPILIPGGNRPGGSNLEDLKTRTISDELQLQGKGLDNKLTYIFGFFYVDEQDENNSPLTGLSLNTIAQTAAAFSLRYHSINEDKSYAFFGQGTYALTDAVNLTIGGRGTTDLLSIHQTPDSSLKGPSLETRETKPSWTGTLDYHLTPELLTYVTTRGSWRVGGYDPFIAPKGDTTTADVGGSYFLPETVRDVEVGAKYNGHLGGAPLQANVDAFNQWSNNVQKSASVLLNGRNTSATANVPAAQIAGLESDFQVVPTNWLRLGGLFAYQNARYTQNHATIYGLSAVFGPYSDVPRFSGSLYSEITAHLGGNAGTLTYHTEVYAQSGQYFGNLGALTPNDEIPGYTLVNMRLDWAGAAGIGGLTLSAFVKNLGDKLYFTGGTASAQGNSLEYTDYGPPRTFGVVARYDF